MADGHDDPEMQLIAMNCAQEAQAIIKDAAQQEKEWAEYLFQDGSMIGLNKTILCQYVEYITNIRCDAIKFPRPFPEIKTNPIPWINTYLSSDNVQTAPQESNVTQYLTGQIESTVAADAFSDMEI